MEKEIKEALKELEEAMIENLTATNEETNAKLAKMKAHKRLILAKEKVNDLCRSV